MYNREIDRRRKVEEEVPTVSLLPKAKHGLLDEDNSEDNEDDCIHGHLGNSFFTAGEPGDQELQDEELADNEVESAEISEYKVEKLAANEEDIIDEA